MGTNPRILIMKKNAAVFMAAVFFLLSSCSLYANTEDEPIFYHNKKIYQFTKEQNVKSLFSVSTGTRNRAFISVPGCFLMCDKTQSKLNLYNKKGKIVSSKKFPSGQIWISDNLIFCNDFVYKANEGFEYSAWLYKTNVFFHQLNLKKIWTSRLDCFNSDLLFEENGKVLLAGKSKEKAENSVYLIDTYRTSSKPLRIFSYPVNSDFARLIHCQNKLIVFSSHSNKSSSPLILYDADFNSVINASGLITFKKHLITYPSSLKISSMYGFGFSYKSDIVIPCAESSKDTADISLLRFCFENDNWIFKSAVNNSCGCYVYLGTDLQNNNVFFLAHDVAKNPDYYEASIYNGTSIIKNILE
jgi:hypothetical protein